MQFVFQLLICSVSANPPAYKLAWWQIMSVSLGMNINSLVLQVTMKQRALKIIHNCWIVKITLHFETSVACTIKVLLS
jgi:hypothetical protein